MSKFEYIITLIIPIIFIAFIIVLSIILYNYTLGDFDGNKGKASQCYSDRVYYNCITEDGENIIVRGYK